MVYKRVRGWTRGGASPYRHLLSTPPPPPPLRINTKLRSVCFLSFAEAMMMWWRYSSDISNKKRVFKVTYQTRVGVFLWAMIGCASIIFGRNFWGAFFRKNIASIICTFDEFCSTKLPFIYHATIFWPEISITGKFKLLIVTFMGPWCQRKWHWTNKHTRIISLVTKVDNILLDLHNFSPPTQPHSIIYC